ncbi:MAG: UDP-N-acetylmuramoyl-L-alanyl-D-glutamate--2,6-diaminopimelate ligase [Bacteroidetes bacterium]|nr:UDP-N-acetylmuramoyl-L-alanyl-D-glutamate--2,6-diaminopimelate ligase [Bacteroidota bacterium]
MKLKDILYKVSIREIHGSTNIKANSICLDSRQLGSGSVFITRKGTAVDAHSFIPSAIENGARVIVCEDLPHELVDEITYICVEDSALALGIMASNFYQNPSENIILCGVTGTNGKTSIASLLYQMFTELGYATGLISTIGNKINNRDIEATHTTPDAIQLNSLLKEMTDAGCTYCFMEVSSHAIDQKRIAGLKFAGGIFTNITHDHLDYHGEFSNYLKVKKAFFDLLPATAFALSNADDKNGKFMLQNTRADKYTYGLKSVCDFRGTLMENLLDGMMLRIDGKEIWCKLIGEFNAYNLMAVYGTAILLKQDRERILTLLSQLDTAEGRFEHFRTAGGITVIVDYAHTPDALQNVLRTINTVRTGNEQLITVVGAGGDRDKSKRPLMGNIAGQLSDKLILTSDNPRSEDPAEIINEMKAGVEAIDYKKLLVITNRKEAISTACALAKKGDIILVAGKGHEKYQEIKGVRYPFDDKKLLEEILIQTT